MEASSMISATCIWSWSTLLVANSSLTSVKQVLTCRLFNSSRAPCSLDRWTFRLVFVMGYCDDSCCALQHCSVWTQQCLGAL
eukprot:169584-Amphidinium_carterae.1